MSVTRLPEILLTIPNSAWPAEPDQPIGQARAEAFTTEREIISPALPGQVRATSGFSIGSGSAVVPQSGNGRPFTPWSRSTDRLVSVGSLARLEALYENGTLEPLGAWKVSSASGSLGTAGIQVPLAETAYGTNRARLPTPCYPYVDAVWIVDVLARQAGYFSTPPPVASCILSVPGVGGVCAEVGKTHADVQPSFSMGTGTPSIAGGGFTAPLTWSGNTVFLTLTTPGVVVTLDEVTLDIGLGSFTITGIGGNQTKTFTAGLDPTWPLRVQAEIWTDGVTTNVRVRSTHDDSAWSAIATVSSSANGPLTYVSGVFSGLQVTTAADPKLWAAPTAKMSLLDAIVERPWIAAESRVWTGLQDTVQAFASAAWLDRFGVLHVLNRHDLAGVDRGKKTFDVDVLADDLPWSITADDYADRMVVTWSPTTAPEDDETLEWSVGSGKIRIDAGQTASYLVDLGGYTETVYGFTHADSAVDEASTWEANTLEDGSGTEITSGVTIVAEVLSPSAVLVRVTNANSVPVWLVDYNGEPALILRGANLWGQESQAQITFGVGEADAKNELAIDLGPLAQDAITAQSIAGYLWDRARINRWRASSIRIPLDLTLDNGDVLGLVHAGTDLQTDALVTRISLAGSMGQIEQVIDLAILTPTVAAFDVLWRDETVSDFDAFWAGSTVQNFDADPLKAS